MQSRTQEQPLALTTVKSHYPTNGKEEEVNTGEEALQLYFKCGPVGSTRQPSSDQQIGMVDIDWMKAYKESFCC